MHLRPCGNRTRLRGSSTRRRRLLTVAAAVSLGLLLLRVQRADAAARTVPQTDGPDGVATVDTTEVLYLEVTLFGQSTNAIVSFRHQDGRFFVQRDDLLNVGIRLRMGGCPNDWLDLSTIAGLTYHYDESHQSIDLCPRRHSGATATAPPNAVAVDFNLGLLDILLGGSYTTNVPIYGYLAANQTTAPAGVYQQIFGSGSTAVNYTPTPASRRPAACMDQWRQLGFTLSPL